MPDASDLIEMAARCYQACVCEEDIAATLAEWAVEMEPTEERLRLLTLYRIHAQEYDKALESAKKLESLSDPRSLNALALAEAANFDYVNAVKHYDRGLMLDPDSMQLYANRAHVRLLAGEYREGAADLVRAFVVGWGSRLRDDDDEPDLGEVQDYFGHVKRMNAKIVGADPAAWRVLRICGAIDNSFGKLTLRLLNPLGKLGDLEWVRHALRAVIMKSKYHADDEIADLQAALKLKPDDPGVLVRLWDRTYSRRKSDEDLAPGRRLAELFPEWMKPRVQVAEALCYMGRNDESLVAANAILEEDPEEIDTLVLRTRVLREKGDFRGALRDIDVAIELTGADNPDLFGTGDWMEGGWEIDRLIERAELCGELGEHATADLHWERAFEIAEICDEAQERDEDGLGSNEWTVLMCRARHYLDKQRWKEALADYDRLMADGEKRTFPEFHEERAKVREGLGDAEGAEADRKRAAEMRSPSPAAPVKKKGRKKA